MLRNRVVNELRKSKKVYYEQLIDSNKYDSAKLWKLLKNLIGNKKKQ